MTISTLAPWLREHLIDTGKIRRDGLARAARARYCKTCGELTVIGLSGDRAAIPAVANPLPLSPLGEALAVLTGRPTFSLRKSGRDLHLDLRDSFHMRTPAGTAAYDVVAGHVCGAAPLPTLPSNLPAPPTRKAATSCPF